MGTINFKKGSKVFFDNEKYTIEKVKNYSEVIIRHSLTYELSTVNIKDLSSKHIENKNKQLIDNYTDKEWKDAKTKFNAIKDLLFRQKTESEVKETADKNNVSRATIYNWIECYEQSKDISSLVSKTSKRGKRGSRLKPEIEDILQVVLEELYLHKQRNSINKIYINVVKECKRLDLTPPHINTIRNRIKDIDPKLTTKKRFGYKAAQEKYDDFSGEYPEGNYPFDVIQIDHTPLDIMLVDEMHREPIGRPYLTLAIDVYSRMIVGFYLSLQAPGYFNVSQCLYSIFSDKNTFLHEQEVEGSWDIHGIPRILHVDNGADLVSSDMQRVCDELNITLLKRPVARPQFGPHVERVLGTINKEVHNLPGTTFSNTQEKANYDSQKEASLTLKELTKWLTHYIVNIYHNKPHFGLSGMAPVKKYEVGIFGDEETAGTGMLPPIVDNIEDIKIILLPTYFRTVQKDGIALDGIRYYSDVLRHWIGITDLNDKKIKHKIKRDPLNIQKIYFFDQELEEYFEVPYKKLSAPVMTLWDLYATKRYLKEKNITDYNEDDIFQAYDVLESIEKQSIDKHKKHKLRKSKPPKISAISGEEKTNISENINNSNHFNSLFEDITLFDVEDKGDNGKY